MCHAPEMFGGFACICSAPFIRRVMSTAAMPTTTTAATTQLQAWTASLPQDLQHLIADRYLQSVAHDAKLAMLSEMRHIPDYLGRTERGWRVFQRSPVLMLPSFLVGIQYGSRMYEADGSYSHHIGTRAYFRPGGHTRAVAEMRMRVTQMVIFHQRRQARHPGQRHPGQFPVKDLQESFK